MTVAELLRLVLSKQWEWSPGMRVRPVLEVDGTVEDVVGLVYDVTPHGLIRVLWPDVGKRDHTAGHLVPDLTDDATAGCLMGMLPGRWMAQLGEEMHVWPAEQARFPVIDPCYSGATLGEACARALLALWGEE